MNYAARLFSNLKISDPNFSNAQARFYPEPRYGKGDAQLPWCYYISLWWSYDPARANDQVAMSYPSNNNHEDEFFLLHKKMNSNIKQNWFSWNKLAYTDSIDGWINDRNWAMALSACKAHIVTWKYFLDTDVQTVLVQQANRVATNM